MSEKFFDTILRGMEEARAYMEGARDGYIVTDSPSINAKGDFRVQAGGKNRTEDPTTNTGKGEQAQMKNAWDSYLDQQLADPTVRQAFEEETKVLGIGLQLADQRKRQGLTQAELAKKIGTSTPQLSRTERRPENVNMRTLIRYAEAVGMSLDIRLVAKQG
jgi:HTH-type transcriptional regulator/antitoxin HipB